MSTNLPFLLSLQNFTPSPQLQMGSPSHTVQERGGGGGGLFQTLDQEKTMLVDKLCQLKRTLAKKEEKIEFYEGHIQQLTDEIKSKSRYIEV